MRCSRRAAAPHECILHVFWQHSSSVSPGLLSLDWSVTQPVRLVRSRKDSSVPTSRTTIRLPQSQTRLASCVQQVRAAPDFRSQRATRTKPACTAAVLAARRLAAERLIIANLVHGLGILRAGHPRLAHPLLSPVLSRTSSQNHINGKLGNNKTRPMPQTRANSTNIHPPTKVLLA